MKVECTRQGDVVTLRPRGLLAGSDVDALQTQLTDTLDAGAAELVLDTSGILFVDSRGLELLVDLAERMIRNGRTLRLAGPNPTLEEVLDLTALAKLFRFYPDAAAAAGSRP
jgi:anti-anti-sigma factor